MALIGAIKDCPKSFNFWMINAGHINYFNTYKICTNCNNIATQIKWGHNVKQCQYPPMDPSYKFDEFKTFQLWSTPPMRSLQINDFFGDPDNQQNLVINKKLLSSKKNKWKTKYPVIKNSKIYKNNKKKYQYSRW